MGFSGGLDSTVLLHLLMKNPQLRHKTHAIHINHGLSPNATLWQTHCQKICDSWEIPLTIRSVKVNPNNIEEDARLKRYEMFAAALPQQGCLLLGHHQDDVAETVFLNLMRGSGVKGLGRIRESYPFGQGVLLRPLLPFSKDSIKTYAIAHGLHWIEDESNENRYFSRNYLRHEVLPILHQRWPKANQKLVECAHHLQHAQDNLCDLAELDCPSLANPSFMLDYSGLLHLEERRLINVILTWFYRLHVQTPNTATVERIVREVMHGKIDSVPIVEWGAYCIRRYQKTLYFSFSEKKETLPTNLIWSCFPEALSLNSRESLVARRAKVGIYVPENALVEIRYRVGGETLRRHQQTQLLKKLFQIHHVPPWQRAHIPLVYVNHELVCVVDFWVRDPYHDADHSCIYEIQRRSRHDSV